MAKAKKKTAKLKTETKFTVALSGSSVPTFLQTLAKDKGVTTHQIVHCLDGYLQDDPKFAKEFMKEAVMIPTSRSKRSSTPKIAELAEQLASEIKKSKDEKVLKNDISFIRSTIKAKNGKTFGYQ